MWEQRGLENLPDVFEQMVLCAQEGQAFEITKQGRPVAVMIGYEEWESLRASQEMSAHRSGGGSWRP